MLKIMAYIYVGTCVCICKDVPFFLLSVLARRRAGVSCDACAAAKKKCIWCAEKKSCLR